MQHSISKVWKVVLPSIPVQSRIVHSYVHGLLDCSCHIVALPAYDLEIFHKCCVASVALCSNIDEGAFKCSLYLSPNILDDSPMYSSSQSILSHMNQ